jgi:hypothetical protein
MPLLLICLYFQNTSIFNTGWKNDGEREEIREKGRESFTEILSFLERFSPHVEIQYIFYWSLSLQTGENLSIFKFLSLSLHLSLPLPSFSLLEVSSCCKEKDQHVG